MASQLAAHILRLGTRVKMAVEMKALRPSARIRRMQRQMIFQVLDDYWINIFINVGEGL